MRKRVSCAHHSLGDRRKLHARKCPIAVAACVCETSGDDQKRSNAHTASLCDVIQYAPRSSRQLFVYNADRVTTVHHRCTENTRRPLGLPLVKNLNADEVRLRLPGLACGCASTLTSNTPTHACGVAVWARTFLSPKWLGAQTEISRPQVRGLSSKFRFLKD